MKQRVLIVDDEPRNQRILSEILEDLVELKSAASGDEALTVLPEFAPDLVLLDIMMPGIDGYEVCRRIRSNPNHAFAKIILVSGKAMVEERLKGYAVGADEYITKPYVPEEMLAKAKVFLRLTQMERDLVEINERLDQKVQERTRQLLDTEARLVQAAKMSALGEMAGGIAHEINTPLATILMISEQIPEMLQDDPVDFKAVNEMLVTARDTATRISQIVRGLKVFSRDGENDDFEKVPVGRVIESTLALCAEKLKNAGVIVEVKSIDPGLHIMCREVQISQVLLNLIGNANDAIEDLKEKRITLAVEKVTEGADGHKANVEISVTDSGPRISDEIQAKIFQPFFTTKEIGRGTGLGLSVSRGIIEAHHGSIHVDPNCPTTRFVVSLPVATSP